MAAKIEGKRATLLPQIFILLRFPKLTHIKHNSHAHRHPDIYFTIPENEHSSKGKQTAISENEQKKCTQSTNGQNKYLLHCIEANNGR
jgi:hypothetical protein